MLLRQIIVLIISGFFISLEHQEKTSWFSSSNFSSTFDELSTRTLPVERLTQPPVSDNHIEVLLDVLEEDNDDPKPSKAEAASPTIPDPIPQRAIALYDCEAENPDELTFKKSEVIVVLKDVEVNWWVSELHTPLLFNKKNNPPA